MTYMASLTQMVSTVQNAPKPKPSLAHWQATLQAQARQGSVKLLAEVSGQQAGRPQL